MEAPDDLHIVVVTRGTSNFDFAELTAKGPCNILPFAEYAPAILDMLRHIAHTDIRDPYIKGVLRACGQYMGSLKCTPQRVTSLSSRELEVLTLAADGLKRDEIAGRLNVSAGTIKTHLENIYRKLESAAKRRPSKRRKN
jgi:LuxR family maltose regulon positive regulatory protein